VGNVLHLENSSHFHIVISVLSKFVLKIFGWKIGLGLAAVLRFTQVEPDTWNFFVWFFHSSAYYYHHADKNERRQARNKVTAQQAWQLLIVCGAY